VRKEAALALIEAAITCRRDRDRFRQAVDKLLPVLDELDGRLRDG
jgi:hypothetical protein